MKSKKYSAEYDATISLVDHEHWVALFDDKKGAKHIRMVSPEDAWKFDIQVGLIVKLRLLPYNKCKLLKVVERPI